MKSSHEEQASSIYRGRLAPSPTGYLHLGHARTFWVAYTRARSTKGILILRDEDLDAARSKAIYAEAILEDLRWIGIKWNEGPDCGGSYGPYCQSKRLPIYQQAFDRLLSKGVIYPCNCSRKEILDSLSAPHEGLEGPIYPGTCRPNVGAPVEAHPLSQASDKRSPNWRFRVPDGDVITFVDGWYGSQGFKAGEDFGDFVIWRHDGIPSYQLAVVVDDAAMRISEVVRGADLLLSTARQILLYRALELTPPRFVHCPLLTDQSGDRLAKRSDAMSLRSYRSRGEAPANLRGTWAQFTPGSGSIPQDAPT